MLKRIFILFLLLPSLVSDGQVQGGESAFQYLRFSTSPHTTALGGLVLFNPSKDVMMSLNNPALLRPSFHTQLGLNYNAYYADTKIMNFFYAHHVPKMNTTFGLGIQYLNYGNVVSTDNIGNVLGTYPSNDFSINVLASKSYLQKWRYGAQVKFAHSFLAGDNSTALLMDVGVLYADTTNDWYAAMAVKNVGYQFQKYTKGIPAQPLPLDVQLAFYKKLKKAPFALSMLAHHLYTWDVRYNNPADVVNNQLIIGDTTNSTKEKNYFADKLMRHLVFAFEMNIGKRLEISAGYNHMRRAELATTDKPGIAGFSYGAGMYLNKMTLHFARSHYHLAGAYNEFGFNFNLNQFFGLGKSSKKINWSEKFNNPVLR